MNIKGNIPFSNFANIIGTSETFMKNKINK